MNMKKIISACMALLVVSLTACNDFLDEPMKGNLNTESIYSSPEEAQLAVNGIYNASTYFINLWRFGDVASDDAVKGGNEGDMSDLNYIIDFTASADNGILSEFWQNTYEVVSCANNVIGNVPGMTSASQTQKDNFVAQAKFFRALAYFTLVNIYGEVPLKLLPQNSPETINVPLSSVESIYTQIEKDLTDAAPSLEINPVEQGRVTRGAAYGLLAKVYLYQQKYSEALSAIANVESLDIYELEKDYADLFKLGSENSKEVVFAIRFLSGQNPGLGNALNQYLAPLEEMGYYFDAPTQDWVNCFTELTEDGETDPRLDASIGRDGMPWLNDNLFQASWSPATGYLVKKHNQPLDEVPAGRKGDGGLPYIYLRYADILLMKAEAYNELHQPDLAKAPLDSVRSRVGLAETTAASESAMRDAIRLERRKELGFEFHRFFDLMRYGREAAQAALPSLPWGETRYYYPIPQAEIDANQAIQ